MEKNKYYWIRWVRCGVAIIVKVSDDYVSFIGIEDCEDLESFLTQEGKEWELIAEIPLP